MARPTTIYLRKLRKKEKEILRQKLRDKTVSARIYERYRVIDIAQQGFSVPEITERSGMHFTGIYDWIIWFNTHGFDGFDDPPNADGRPSSLSGGEIRQMIKVALSRPSDLGLPYTHWSVSKLKAYLTRKGIFPDYSDEWVRRLLRREGISFQRTKNWKESPDPDFEVKKNRVLRLYEKEPYGGHVVCFDEFGPMELRPIPGQCWAKTQHPQRLPATYHWTAGVEQLLGFYDVHADILEGIVHKRKTSRDPLQAWKRCRRCYPKHHRIYLVMDNLSSHNHETLRRYARNNRMRLVPTPTYASWLNAIEAHFGPLKSFCLNNSDDRTHQERRRRIYRYLTRRNVQRNHANQFLSFFRKY